MSTEEEKGKKEGGEVEKEYTYTVDLGRVFTAPRYRRAPKTVKALRVFVARHMRAKPEEVRISPDLNELIWSRGLEAGFRRIRVKVVKDEEGIKVSPAAASS